MARKDLRKKIQEGLFALDGAMGTQLIAHGFGVGICTEYLNIEKPEIVSRIHQAYLEAGSDAVITNTFGANSYSLKRHGHSDEVEKVNAEAAKIARQAAGEEKYVLGNIGPTGKMLEPFGDMTVSGCKKVFTEQAAAIADAGVDGFMIETMTALNEIAVAITAVKSVCSLPIFVSLAYDYGAKGFKTMMGVDVDSAVSQIVSLGVDAVGFNCGGLTLANYIQLASKYTKALRKLDGKVQFLAEPNAGLPQMDDGQAVYKVSPEDFAEAARKIHSEGINIIGGCCGTGPEHIKAMVEKLR